MEEYCICKHVKSAHQVLGGLITSKIKDDGFCKECFHSDPIKFGSKWVHSFKLDNLNTIEQEAKKRNLI